MDCGNIYTNKISTHTPLARCDRNLYYMELAAIISTHTPLARCDDNYSFIGEKPKNFYSHTSREVWRICKNSALSMWYFYSHTSREVWQGAAWCCRIKSWISTHTPLARCDYMLHVPIGPSSHFYSHTSREVWQKWWGYYNGSLHFYSHTSREVWPCRIHQIWGIVQFLLTHLSRGVTNGKWSGRSFKKFLLTHLSRGVTRIPICKRGGILHFYSHTSREVWPIMDFGSTVRLIFLLTHLSRGVTFTITLKTALEAISTHTPLARCDCLRRKMGLLGPTFLLTHLSRGVTCIRMETKKADGISTHTPLARCDHYHWGRFISSWYFYSHTSREVWQK